MNVIIAIVEVIVCVLIIRWILNQKAGEKFSGKFVRRMILLGLLSAILVLAIGILIPGDPFSSISNPVLRGFVMILLTAAILEEGMKYLCFRLTVRNSSEVRTIHDAILVSAVVAMAFDMFENVEYSLFGNLFSALRILFPMHLVFGAAMGYFYGKAKAEGKAGYHVLSLLVPILLHTIFDWPIAVTQIVAVDPATHKPYPGEVLLHGPNAAVLEGALIVCAVVGIVSLILVILTFRWMKKGKTDETLQRSIQGV